MLMDITWCSNTKCKMKDCRRRQSKRPRYIGGCYSVSEFEGGENCKNYWSENE
jgi:hypothetical protein